MTKRDYGTPWHEHDCKECIYLGKWVHFNSLGELLKCDLYFCNQGGTFPTVIARYTSEGPDYSSGLPFGEREYAEMVASSFEKTTPLAVAYHRAKNEGFI